MSHDAGSSSTRCSACGGFHSPADLCATGGGARVGTVLDGKYELVRLLGQGGMGEVYEGRHTKIGRRVAVKFLHPHYAKHAEVARRFENEAMVAGGAEHENIAAVFDVGVLPDGAPYLVMEYLDGEDLDRVLRGHGRLSLARAADVVLQACLGLDVVHRRGVVHRDLKPANLFVTRRANKTDLIKVIDFGIAKLRRIDGSAGATKTGIALGTAYYMSPEQARGERDIGTASDVYALGVILYELLSGQRPHDGDSLLQILHRILTQTPTPLEEVSPGLPTAVYGVVRKAMAATPTDRFSSVTELADALAPFAAAARSPSQMPPSLATRPETAHVRASSLPLAVPSAGSPPPMAARSVIGFASTATGPHAASKKRRTTALLGLSGGTLFAAVLALLAVTIRDKTAVTPPLPSTPESIDATAPIDANRTEAPDAASSSPIPAPVTSTSASVKKPSPPPPPPPPKPDCSPNFTLDDQGRKHFKPECFLRK